MRLPVFVVFLVIPTGIVSLPLVHTGAKAGQTSSVPGRTFTDITKESGLEALVNAHYAKYPKWWLSGLHLVDLDSDGKLDLFLSAHGAGKALALLNDGTGRFTPAAGNYPNSEIHLAYDCDEDGKLDLTMTFQDGGGKWWLNRSTPGNLAFAGTKMERPTNTARRQAMIDINRDGKVDWLRGTPQGIVFELGDGRGNFVPNSAPLRTGGKRPETLCLPVDVTGSGQIDLLVEWGHYESPRGNSRVLHNDGKMGFTDATQASGLKGEGFSIKGAGDLNQDGFPDLMVIENMKPEIYLNDGKGRFVKKAGALAGMERANRPAYASWGLAVVTDLDNDGTPDILWNGRNFLWALRGAGAGKFEYMNKAWGIEDQSAASIDDGLCFGDIDGDGALDIVGYTNLGGRRRFAVYRNELPKRHWLNVRPIGRPGNRGAAGAKIRLLEPGSNKLLWYEQVVIGDSQAAASYYSFAQTERHFGLGARTQVDVAVEFYPSRVRVERKGVSADSTVEIREPLR